MKRLKRISRSGKHSRFSKEDRLWLLREIFQVRVKGGYTIITVDGAGPRVRGEYKLGGVGIIVTKKNEDDTINYRTLRFTYNHPDMTSPFVEVLALTDGIKAAIEERESGNTDKIIVLSDCEFAVGLCYGGRCTKEHLVEFVAELKQKLTEIDITVCWFSRELNVIADKASKEAAEIKDELKVINLF
jgi:ribonuclease HI